MKLPLAGRPLVGCSGEVWSYVGTDAEEWIGFAADGTLRPASARLLERSAVGVDGEGDLLVAMFDAMIAKLDGGSWRFARPEAAALCFGSHPGGEIAGLVSGALVALGVDQTNVLLRIRDPIVAIGSYSDGNVIVGSRGMFGRLRWPLEVGPTLEWIETPALGRPLDVFPALEADRIGLIARDRVGVLDPATGRTTVAPTLFDEGVRAVVLLGAHTMAYAVLTDAGSVFLLDSGLTTARRIALPAGTVAAGCVAGGSRGAAAVWTTGGDLLRIAQDGRVDRLIDGDVALAVTNDGAADIAAVRYRDGEGTTLERVAL
jgi:hypothetical protein